MKDVNLECRRHRELLLSGFSPRSVSESCSTQALLINWYSPLQQIEHGVHGNLSIICPKPYSMGDCIPQHAGVSQTAPYVMVRGKYVVKLAWEILPNVSGLHLRHLSSVTIMAIVYIDICIVINMVSLI